MLVTTIDAIGPLDPAELAAAARSAPVTVIVFAGDHGVYASGVSAHPRAMTARWVGEALAAGGRTVIDVGVAGCLTERPGLIIRKIRAGTRDFTAEPALTVDEACAAIEIGIGAADNAVDGGARVLRTATLGVASAPSVRAILKVMTPSRDLGNLFVGSDAGNSKIADAAVLHGIARHRPDRCDPLAVLAAFGGLEQAALVGFILAAAAHRVPVIIDGMDGESAVAVAVALAPAAAAVVTYPEPAPWASQALSGQGDGGGQR